MAITNAQQYQQLVNKPANGKRPGYRGIGGYQSGRSGTSSRSSSRSTSTNQGPAGGASAGGNYGGNRNQNQTTNIGGGSNRTNRLAEEQREKEKLTQTQINNSRKFKKEQEKKRKEAIKKSKTFNPFPIATKFFDKLNNSKLAKANNAMQRQNYIDSLDLTNPEEKEEYDRIMNEFGGLGMDIIAGPTDLESTMLSVPPSMLATDPMTQFKKVDGVSTLGDHEVRDVLGTGYDEYLDRFKTTNDGGGDNQVMDPCKGPNPPAYCAVNNDSTDPATPKRNLGGLAPRFAGSIFDFTGLADGGRAGKMDGGMMEDTPEGGIMDLETGRQMYFLGKLVKKATRAVKKVAKSPLGKAALLGGAMYFSGLGGKASSLFGKGSFFGTGFNPLKDSTKIGPLSSGFGKFLSKFGIADRVTGDLTLGGKLGLGFGVPFALDMLGVGKEKDDDNSAYEKYMKDMGLDINKYRYGNYLAPAFTGYGKADGGRIGYAEGSEEPVAKETMPLLDMDGKEMDLREDGGFVPLGRMERADDVPARLSKNEFVFTADAVRNAGEGDIDKGAEVMYNMMKNLESGGEVSEESQGLDGAREMFKTSQRLEEVL